MSFLDKKEEVIEIQLTQYGKHLLSRGKFSPKMYAFFDDDVLYDSEYGDIEERGIDTQNRIEEESVRMKTQYVFSSREKEVKRLTASLVSGKVDLQDRIIQPTAERHYALAAPLGNSSLGVNKAPAWKISFLKGETSERVEHLTGALPTLKIPQLKLKPIMYKTRVWFDIPPDNSFSAAGGRVGDAYGAGSQGDLSVTLEQYEDGSYVSVQEDYALIDVREINSDFLNENFDIEVFLVEDVDFQNNIVPPSMKHEIETREKLYPLSFIQQKKFIKDGFLLDTPEGGPADENPEIDPSYVEYWFNIWVDDEIDERVIKLSEVEPGENIYMAKDSDRARGRGGANRGGPNRNTRMGAPSSDQIIYGSRGYTSGGTGTGGASGYGIIIEDDGECNDE